MGPTGIFVLNKLRNQHYKLFRKKTDVTSYVSKVAHSGQNASDLIHRLISAGRPAMIARFGSVEMECVTTYYLRRKNSFLKNCRNYIKGKSDLFWWNNEIRKQMFNNAGFFPVDNKNLDHFSELMLDDINELDVLGCWLEREKYLKNELKNKIIVPLKDIEPYYHQRPWTSALKGKKVLVIHPYERSILSQYQKRKLLFTNKDILPEFELTAIRSVQSISGNKTEFNTWLDALDHMKKQIDHADFDVAIIGCGAYGFPLAAHVKRKGKIAIHLGGATQILFGIKGKRWEEIDFFMQLFNKHWVRPLAEETPENSSGVESGCYW
jgi:hypothetical protein